MRVGIRVGVRVGSTTEVPAAKVGVGEGVWISVDVREGVGLAAGCVTVAGTGVAVAAA